MTTSCCPGRTWIRSIPQLGVGEGAQHRSRAVASTTESPSTSSGAGWPAIASRTGSRRVFVDRHRGDAAEGGAAAGQQFAVEGLQGDHRVAGERRRGAQRVAGEGGDGGGLGAAAGDVADHHHPAAGDAEGVVEVAADLVLGAGRPVHRRHRPAGDVRQRRRQQPALQGLGDLRPFALAALEVGEEAGVVERQRHAPGEDPGEVGVVLAEAAARVADPDREHARSAAPRARSSTVTKERTSIASRKRRSSSLSATGRRSSSVTRSNSLGSCRATEAASAMLLLQGRLALGEPLFDRLRVGAVDADGGAADPALLDHVDHAVVAERGDEDRGDRVQGLLQRAPAVGHRGDFVEDLEAAPVRLARARR